MIVNIRHSTRAEGENYNDKGGYMNLPLTSSSSYSSNIKSIINSTSKGSFTCKIIKIVNGTLSGKTKAKITCVFSMHSCVSLYVNLHSKILILILILLTTAWEA